MTTLFNTISAVRTAEGSPLNPELALDFFGNDWSLIGGAQDLYLLEDNVPATTTPTWLDMQDIWFEMPTWDDDTTFDALETRISLNVQARATANANCSIRLVNEAETLIGTAVGVTVNGGYTISFRIELTFPAANLPTGRTQIKIQGSWASDPGGGEQLNVRRINQAGSGTTLGDCEIFVRLVP